MKAPFLFIALLSVFLAFGCSEENKTTNTAASHNNGTPENNNSQTPDDHTQTPTESPENHSDDPQTTTQEESIVLQAKIDDAIVQIQWEDNDAVKALKEMAKTSSITVNMSQYGGFEQVGSLGKSLPRNDSKTTTNPGDIVLYSGDQIVVFYGSNSWSYTRLGKITDKSEAELKSILDKPNVTLVLSTVSGNVQADPASSEKKSLVAYFSVTKNTKGIAEYISEHTNSVLYEIIPEQPYTDEDIDYSDSSSRTSIEQNDPDARPAIASTIENIEQYDIIYLGYPIWWGQAPKIMYTFLESVTIKENTTIVPFVTSGSSSIGTSATNLESSASTANWLEGRRFAAGTNKSTVTQWVDSLNLH